jgi:hypothetical protein
VYPCRGAALPYRSLFVLSLLGQGCKGPRRECDNFRYRPDDESGLKARSPRTGSQRGGLWKNQLLLLFGKTFSKPNQVLIRLPVA